MTVVSPLQKYIEYDEDTLNHIHKVLTDVLRDFVNICEENNIEYYCAFGTALGAVRHQGFIPWDDDLDVIMFRKEYEKFSKIMDKKTEKYELLSLKDDGFFRLIVKLNLKGTNNGEPWDINTDFTLGLGLDIFILDNLPTNNLKKKIYIRKVLLLKIINLTLLSITNDRYFTKNAERIGHFIRMIFKLTGNKHQNFIRRLYNKLISYPEGKEVCELSAAYTIKVFPIEIFSPPKKAKFENLTVNVPKDYDTYLKIIYGDYMTLPPEEERVNHGFKIDFGPY